MNAHQRRIRTRSLARKVRWIEEIRDLNRQINQKWRFASTEEYYPQDPTEWTERAILAWRDRLRAALKVDKIVFVFG